MGNTNSSGDDTNKSSISEFYRHFVKVTNDGKVLNLDISQREDLGIRKDERGRVIVLTVDEQRERAEWNRQKSEQINKYYDSLTLPLELSQEEFLSLRVAAPCLVADAKLVSSRSPLSDHVENRHYPQRVQVWDDFHSSVGAFRVDRPEKVPRDSIRGVELSLSDVGRCFNESYEEGYLVRMVLQPLMDAKLIGTVQIGSRNCQGEPDFSILKPDTEIVKVVGESKATHNLPLPMKAWSVAKMYNEAIDAMPEREHERVQQKSPLGWSHVGRPISQTLGYMILSHCRYGVLTSGTRTYFLHIQRDTTSGEESVLISDAWFVGQENYLRAWAFLYVRAIGDSQPTLNQSELSKTWFRSTPEKVKKRKLNSQGAPEPKELARSTNGQGQGQANSRSHNASIARVTLADFEVGQPIGHGRRGTAFSGTWNGEVVALKLFDTYKNKGGEAFERELKAYEHLKEAWGRLVPTPKFFCEAFGVIFFGMQMAEHPPQNARLEDWDEVLWELEETYGFRHLDVDGDERGPNFRNHMILRDDKGHTQPIVIDLEEYELLHCAPSSDGGTSFE